MKEKLAVALTGIHYFQNYDHFTNSKYNINFKKYVRNIKIKIYNFFEKKYNIDTFIVTNPSIYQEELISIYNPVKYIINETFDHTIKKINSLEMILEYSNSNNKKYHLILVTRFDIYFLKDFTNIDPNKFNIISTLEKPHLWDDNVYIFPFHYLSLFLENLKKLYDSFLAKRMVCHNIKHLLDKLMLIHYIDNENVCVDKLSFFKLRYFDNILLIINKHLFSENIEYFSKNNACSIVIFNENCILFKKMDNRFSPFCWVGYNMETVGKFLLTFDVYSNFTIENYGFIKLHNPVIFLKIDKINENEWKKISIEINIKNENDLLLFIFDDFLEKINIQINNIEIIHI